MINALCGNGADLNKYVSDEIGSSNHDGDCPLHVAVRNGRAEAINALLDHGADPTYVNHHFGRNRSVRYVLDIGRYQHSGMFGFFCTQVEKRIGGTEANYDLIEQCLNECTERNHSNR